MLNPIHQLILEKHNLNHYISFDPIKIVLIKLCQKLDSFIWLYNILHHFIIDDDIFALLPNPKQYKYSTYDGVNLKIVQNGYLGECDFCTNVTKKHHKEDNYAGLLFLNDIGGDIIFNSNITCFPYLMFTMYLAPFVTNYTLFLCYAHHSNILPIDIVHCIGFLYLQRCYLLCNM